MTHHDWRILTASFKLLKVSCARDVNLDRIWSAVIKSQKTRLTRSPFHGLPLIARCKFISPYTYSKVIYLDRCQPCLKPLFNDFENTGYDATWSSRRPQIQRLGLGIPREHGGIGFPSLVYGLRPTR